MLSESIDGTYVESESSRRVRLGVLLDELAVSVFDDRPLDEEHGVVEVDVLPSEQRSTRRVVLPKWRRAGNQPSGGIGSSAIAIRRTTSAGAGGATSWRGSRGGEALTAGFTDR